VRKRKKQLYLLGISFLSLVGFIYLILSFSPNLQIPVLNFNLSIVYFFFTLIFLFLFSLFAFIFKSLRRGVFIGAFVVIYLFLRLNHLSSLFFLVMLFVLFGCLELFFVKRG